MTTRGGLRDVIAVGALAGLLAAAVASSSSRAARRERGPESRATRVRFSTPRASFQLQASRARLVVQSSDRLFAREVDLVLVVDGVAHPLVLRPQDVTFDGKDSAAGTVRLSVTGAAQHDVVPVDVVLRASRDLDALVLSASTATAHTIALRAEIPMEGRPLFVSGVGEVGDLAEVRGPAVVLEADAHPLAATSPGGALDIVVKGDASGDAALHASVTSRAGARADLALAVGASSAALWRAVASLAGTPSAEVTGEVRGTRERAHVIGLDRDGAPRVRATTDDAGRFVIAAPEGVVAWYATVDAARASEPTPHVPAAPGRTSGPLLLDVSPGGEIRVVITDPDTGAPLTARLIVHGIDGTLDPSFGPDYRASGAGPLIDALRGEVTTPVPAGRYRVAATKGIEWSIDAKEISVASGHSVRVALAPRHVVPTPDFAGCDLHVHARPSFDTPVTVEDRVLSLVAAGVDFAVPTEHNVVGDYGPPLAVLGLTPDLAWVHGVEVTTYSPRIGHFGVFPYPPGPVPPYRGTSAGAVLAAARKGDAARIVQVNHPRMGYGIGYFERKGFRPSTGRVPADLRTDFDALEVYNGYDLEHPDRVGAVMRDWFALLALGRRLVATGSSDAHRIQYHWAGYPRTFVRLPAGGGALDSAALVASLKAGHAFVSSGPILDVAIDGHGPGDAVNVDATTHAVKVRVRVFAAPWVDVTSVELMLGGRVVRTLPVASRATYVGPEVGSRAEAEARTLRIDEEISLPVVGDAESWVCAVARGTRKMDDILPFMPVVPLGITNPIWINTSTGARNERHETQERRRP